MVGGVKDDFGVSQSFKTFLGFKFKANINFERLELYFKAGFSLEDLLKKYRNFRALTKTEFLDPLLRRGFSKIFLNPPYGPKSWCF